MNKEEMLEIFLEETGFSKDDVINYGKICHIKDNNGREKTLNRYALGVTIFNSPLNYNVVFMSDRFELVES